MGIDPLSIALAAGGTLAQGAATNAQAKEKRAVMNRQLERDDAASKKGNLMIQTEGDQFAPDQRLKAMQGQEDQTFANSLTDLKSGAGGELGAVGTSGDAGNVSADFIKGKAERAITEGSRLTSLAREIAKTRAPGMLQATEGQRRANLASDLSGLYGTNANMAHATQNDAGAVEEPGYGALGSIASSIGMGMAAQGLNKGGINFGPRQVGRGDL